jgi:hypothetical protein
MKTADTIEQQEERKKTRDDRSEDPRSLRENTQPVTQKKSRYEGYGKRIAKWQWKPGVSPNPGGRPKNDVAQEIARAVFENNAEALYKAYSKAALKGNAYAFKELADRAYGKLKESIHAEISPYHEYTDEELEKHIKELQEKLGFSTDEELQQRVRELEQQLGYAKVLPPTDPESKPN